MSYLESAEGVAISRARAIRELRAHGCTDVAAFYAECGDCETYDAGAVLRWLGY